MLKIYTLSHGTLANLDPSTCTVLPEDTIWLDLHNPTLEELSRVSDWTGKPSPTPQSMSGIEESSRFYTEDGHLYMTAPLLITSENGQHSVAPVSFTIFDKMLVTVRYNNASAFASFIFRASKPGNGLFKPHVTGLSVLLKLIDATIDQMSDELGNMNSRIDEASNAIFPHDPKMPPMTTKQFHEILTQLGKSGTSISKYQESISGLSRILFYIRQRLENEHIHKEIENTLSWLEKDISSLQIYTESLLIKINFLLDTVVGLVSVEQNQIIKVFSIVSVCLMPPTLIASIYGMNFHWIPELSLPLGYPLAVLAMLISVVIPLIYFRFKDWI